MTAPANRPKQLNRAEVVDQNFRRLLVAHPSISTRPRAQHEALRPGTGLTVGHARALYRSQLISRQLDLMARVLRNQNKVYYTIGSSGHEGNALVAHHCRHTDPAFLHYRSGAFMAERSRKLPGIDPIWDSALSFAASSADPASGGRHKVWGSKALWVLPQTSTIASHLPKAVGTALAIEQARRLGRPLPIPADSIAIASFGDASANHSTAQGAFNAAAWAAHQGLKVPVLFVCEDNGIGISVRTPDNWIARSFEQRHGLDYHYADGLDLAAGHDAVQAAVEHCRSRRRPTFLHLRTVRLMGHAGTDFEIEYRDLADIEASEALDPLLASARLLLDAGVASAAELLAEYEQVARDCLAAAERADRLPRLATAAEIMAPLAPLDRDAVEAEATRAQPEAERVAAWGGAERLPETQPPRHLAILINQALSDLLGKYPEALVFGEDVAQKGGVYTVTKGLYQRFRGQRVFNTLLDEQTILGMAQGYAYMGLLPIPEIQYLAYFHNACDQVRGEACSLQFFSNGQYQNPMVIRIAGLGYQRGFGGHFHNDNSITALRDIPALTVACASRGDDAVRVLRTLTAMAKVNGRVSVFLEPIALYMTKDLYAPGDGLWQSSYPAEHEAQPYGLARVYEPAGARPPAAVIYSYGNGVPMALRAAAQTAARGSPVRVVDLIWLQPLNEVAIADYAEGIERVLVLDEGRHSGGVGEGVITALIEAGHGHKPISRVVGEDSYTALGPAAGAVLPSDESVLAELENLLAGAA